MYFCADRYVVVKVGNLLIINIYYSQVSLPPIECVLSPMHSGKLN